MDQVELGDVDAANAAETPLHGWGDDRQMRLLHGACSVVDYSFECKAS